MSYWSSAVCSFDLPGAAGRGTVLRPEGGSARGGVAGGGSGRLACAQEQRHARIGGAGIPRDLPARRTVPADRTHGGADRFLRRTRRPSRVQGRRRARRRQGRGDRKSVGEGKSVAVGGDLGG